MRISDWSSDVCSSDLSRPLPRSTHRTLLPRRGALLTDRLELAARLPLGPARRARELVADAVEDIDVLNRAVEVPVRPPGIARLMIAFARIEIGRASCRERVCQYV